MLFDLRIWIMRLKGVSCLFILFFKNTVHSRPLHFSKLLYEHHSEMRESLQNACLD